MERTVGRRKTATARVRISPGKGEIIINGQQLTSYFPTLLLQQTVLSPLVLIGREKEFSVTVKVVGSGLHSQAEAVRHGIARALVEWNTQYRPLLRAEGFLTRDPRAKERKKYGRYRARRGHQWRKR